MTNSNGTIKSRAPKIRIAVMVLLFALLLGISAYAWLSHEKSVGVVGEIDAPLSLYIRAGNNEDAKYLDMSNIDVSEGTEKYYVFAVAGEYVNSFKLQLAYTTNNQFEYEIYYAKQAENQNEKNTALKNAVVTCYPHTAGNNQPIDYIIDPAKHQVDTESGAPVPIQMTQINPSNGNSKLADPNHPASKETYESYLDTYGRDPSVIHENAWPLYWQTANSIVTDGDAFVQYFLLHVTWTSRSNDKETDIIYIATGVG